KVGSYSCSGVHGSPTPVCEQPELASGDSASPPKANNAKIHRVIVGVRSWQGFNFLPTDEEVRETSEELRQKRGLRDANVLRCKGSSGRLSPPSARPSSACSNESTKCNRKASGAGASTKRVPRSPWNCSANPLLRRKCGTQRARDGHRGGWPSAI